MQHKWVKIFLSLGLGLTGLSMLVVALFAYQLHIDNNPSMGSNRIALACLGGFLLLFALSIYYTSILQQMASSFFGKKLSPFLSWLQRPYRWLFQERQTGEDNQSPAHRTGWFAAAGCALSIFISLWYITSGRFFTWTPSTVFFDRQANAFLSGQLALLEKPPAALSTVDNPYVYTNRVGISGYFWDASYYQGRYYYYWGPVSGLLAAGIKLFNRSWLIQDQFLVMIAVAGLAIVQAFLIHWLQKKYFPQIPGWIVLDLVLLSILNTPVFWLVNRPIVHEVPISAGQLFLILGLYTLIRGMESQKFKALLLALTGFFWGAAIGSRLDLVIGIGWMVLLALLFQRFKANGRQPYLGGMIALVLPLILWGAGMAWYNYARFGNILETGHRYQLTGGALPSNYSDIVSVSYILPNLYNLLARPFEIHWNEFPFFFTPWIRNNMWPKMIFFPRNLTYFYGEPIAGLLACMPSIWFVAVTYLAMPLRGLIKGQSQRSSFIERWSAQPVTTWLGWMVTGAIILNLGFLSIFIFSTMRYLADVTPLLTVLLTLCIGWAGTLFFSKPRVWRLILALAGGLILASILISLLTNFQNGNGLFKTGNPQLYQGIERFFTPK